jgi:hypothetical protein
MFLIALDNLVLHREMIVRIDRSFLGHEIAHMTIRGHDIEILAQIFADSLRLGGRLNND